MPTVHRTPGRRGVGVEVAPRVEDESEVDVASAPAGRRVAQQVAQVGHQRQIFYHEKVRVPPSIARLRRALATRQACRLPSLRRAERSRRAERWPLQLERMLVVDLRNPARSSSRSAHARRSARARRRGARGRVGEPLAGYPSHSGAPRRAGIASLSAGARAGVLVCAPCEGIFSRGALLEPGDDVSRPHRAASLAGVAASLGASVARGRPRRRDRGGARSSNSPSPISPLSSPRGRRVSSSSTLRTIRPARRLITLRWPRSPSCARRTARASSATRCTAGSSARATRPAASGPAPRPRPRPARRPSVP